MSRNRGLSELYYREKGSYSADYYPSNHSEISYRESERSNKLPRTPMNFDLPGKRLKHLTLLQDHRLQPQGIYGYTSADSPTAGMASDDFSTHSPAHHHRNINTPKLSSDRNTKPANRHIGKYGFNLPTSERLRTRNAEVETPSAKSKGLARGYSSKEEAVAVSAGLIVRGFTEKTTSHGIPHIYFASGVIKKLIWTVVSVAALAALCLHLYLLISSWREFEISSRQTTQQERKLVFPAVSICNYNTLRLSTLSKQVRLNSLIEESSNQVNGTRQRAQLKFDLVKQLAEEYASLSDAEFVSLGHNASELALFCSFHGQSCEIEDFTYFRDPRYGNCITFNSGRLAGDPSNTLVPLKTSSVTGPENGLSLVVFVEQFEYIPMLTQAVGATLVIHNQTVMPFPEQNAISVTVNSLVNIGIKKISQERLSEGRYGNCTDYDDNTNNIYHDKYQVDYSQTACLRTCLQREVTKSCSCHLATIPFDNNSTVFDNLPDLPVCNNSLPAVESCVTQVETEYQDGTTPCTYCYSACDEIEFGSSVSSAIWPADSYLDDFITDLNNTYPDIMRRINRKASQVEMGQPAPTTDELSAKVKELVKLNFLQVNIYYEQMQVLKFKEIVIYDDYQFASDLGGSFGLWVGWSVMTMVEFTELALDLLVYMCYGCCGRGTKELQK